jgi:hypothetical protein
MNILRLKRVRLGVILVAIALVLLVFLQPNRAQQSTSAQLTGPDEFIEEIVDTSTIVEQDDCQSTPPKSDFRLVDPATDEESEEGPLAGDTEPLAGDTNSEASEPGWECEPPHPAGRFRAEEASFYEDDFRALPAVSVAQAPWDPDADERERDVKLAAAWPAAVEEPQPAPAKRPLLDFFSSALGTRTAPARTELMTFPVGPDRSTPPRGDVSAAGDQRQRRGDFRLTTWQDPKLRPEAADAEGDPLAEPLDGSCTDDYCRDGARCGETCWDCCLTDPCCMPTWQVFGEVMAMRARKAQVEYAVPIDGAIVAPPAVPIQVGPTGIVDPDYEFAFRLGFSRALNSCSNIGVTYWRLESETNDEIATTAPNVIRSMVSHPTTLDAAADFLFAGARHDIDFGIVDVDYRRIFSCGPQHQLRWLVGARYAGLDQDFGATLASLGTEGVGTRLDFDGAGPRLGLEGEVHSCGTGLFAYGKTAASFLVGNFQGSYLQTQSFDPVVVHTTWKAGWAVPILDLELGVGWQSRCGRVRLSGGYLLSGWYDVVKTADYINAVQTNNYRDLGHTMVFDGLTARAEIRF